jgi:hypothetical protein
MLFLIGQLISVAGACGQAPIMLCLFGIPAIWSISGKSANHWVNAGLALKSAA